VDFLLNPGHGKGRSSAALGVMCLGKITHAYDEDMTAMKGIEY
jgi:ATP:corrinoid adenosyltransferase